MNQRASTLLVLMAFSACGRRTIELPAVDDAKSVVLLLEGDTSIVEAHQLDAPSRRVSADEAELYTALFYPVALGALGLSEGTVPLFTGNDGRLLPTATDVFQRTASEKSWRGAMAEDSALYQNFRIPPESPSACAAYGGCYPDREDRACRIPCPEPEAPSPPELAESMLPALTPCPAGWTEVSGEYAATCAPRPEESCARGSYPFLGGPCAPITAACAADGWPEPPSGRTVFWVRAGAAGTGTQNDPFGSIDAALDASPPASIIAIAPGTYGESIALDGGRELLGACAEEVVLTGVIAVSEGVIAALTVEGSVGVDRSLTIEGVRLSGAGLLVSAPGAEVKATRIVAGGPMGAIDMAAGSLFRIDDSVLMSTDLIASAVAMVSATATITRTSIFGTVEAIGGALTLGQSVLERLDGGAVLHLSGGTIADGTDLVIRGNGESPAIVGAPANLTLRKTQIATGLEGVQVSSGASTLLEDVFLSQNDRNGEGAGVRSADGGILVARRMLIVGSDAGFWVDNTNVLITASTFRDCSRGVAAGNGTELRVEKSIFREMDKWAITVDGIVDRPGDTFQLVDLELRELRGGIRVVRSQVGRIERVAMFNAAGPIFEGGRNNSSPMVFATDLRLENLVCDTTEPECSGILIDQGSLELNRFAMKSIDVPAIFVDENGAARLINGRISDAPIGIQAFGRDRAARALLERVVFEDVPQPCEPCGE